MTEQVCLSLFELHVHELEHVDEFVVLLSPLLLLCHTLRLLHRLDLYGLYSARLCLYALLRLPCKLCRAKLFAQLSLAGEA